MYHERLHRRRRQGDDRNSGLRENPFGGEQEQDAANWKILTGDEPIHQISQLNSDNNRDLDDWGETNVPAQGFLTTQVDFTPQEVNTLSLYDGENQLLTEAELKYDGEWQDYYFETKLRKF